jgi:hypothetical protein
VFSSHFLKVFFLLLIIKSGNFLSGCDLHTRAIYVRTLLSGTTVNLSEISSSTRTIHWFIVKFQVQYGQYIGQKGSFHIAL